MRPRIEAVPRVVPRVKCVRHVVFWKERPSVQGAAFSMDAVLGSDKAVAMQLVEEDERIRLGTPRCSVSGK
jgi:hypothetical protein